MNIAAKDFLTAGILIVDDQAANVQLLERTLRDSGYLNLSSTTDPRTVRALHGEHHYDLIVLDLKMPLMDGFQVMEELKRDAPDDYLPVIVLTAEPGHKLRALQAGAKDFVSKPFDLVEVKTRIHNMLEVRLLYRRLEQHNEILERRVQERTAELRQSEARFRSLTELASDWYWEQDEHGNFVKVSGPVQEMLGIAIDAAAIDGAAVLECGWNEGERAALRSTIAARRPFLDFGFSRVASDGSARHFRISGEPMFAPGCRYVGYRGIGVEMTPPPQL